MMTAHDDLIILTEARPTRADALKNRAHLLEVARDLFEKQSVEAVSMTAIAEAAGVGKGTLYRHFENKNELCMALLDHDQRELQERTFEHLRGSFDAQADLHWFLSAVLDFVLGHASLLSVNIPGPENYILEHPAHFWWRLTIRGLLGRLAFDSDRDLDYMTDILYLLVNVQTVLFQRNSMQYDVERIRTNLCKTVDTLIS